MKAFSVKELSFSYSSESNGGGIFEGFNLDIEKEKVTAILGPNGSGKSTILSLLLGYLHPLEGSIELLGRDLKDYSRNELGRLVGFVSQSGTLPFNYPVLDYLLLGRASRIALWEVPSKKDLEAVNGAVEKAGISALVERNVQELSAGEMQLVAVARALSQEPQVLLLDEPTSHLDPANALLVFRLLQKLSQEGLTVLLATHDPLHARQAAQRAVLLKQGKLLFSGDSAEGLTAERLSDLYGVPFHEARFGGEVYPFLGL